MSMPLLPSRVDFEWVKLPTVEDENNGSKITAEARIGGTTYIVIHHDPTKKFSEKEARDKLNQMTDKIILMKTRYLYPDVVAIRFNERNNEMRRTYTDPGKHKNKPPRFDYDFDRQLADANRKLALATANTDKYRQIENRILRITETKALWDFLNRRGIQISGNEEFTIERKRTTLPVVSPQLPVHNALPPPSLSQEQRFQELTVAYQQRIQQLELENKKLREDSAVAAQNQVAINHLKIGLEEHKQALEKAEREKAELLAQLNKGSGVFGQVSAQLSNIADAVNELLPIEPIAPPVNGVRPEAKSRFSDEEVKQKKQELQFKRAQALKKLEEEVFSLRNDQEARLLREQKEEMAMRELADLFLEEVQGPIARIPSPVKIDQLTAQILANEDAEVDSNFIRREAQLIEDLRKAILERENALQAIRKENFELRMSLTLKEMDHPFRNP